MSYPLTCSRKDLRSLRLLINKGQNSTQFSKCHPVLTLISTMDGSPGGWGMFNSGTVSHRHTSPEIRSFGRPPPMRSRPFLRQLRQINDLTQSTVSYPFSSTPYPQQWKEGHGSHISEYQVGGANKSALPASSSTCRETKAQIGQMAYWSKGSMWWLPRAEPGSLDSRASTF